MSAQHRTRGGLLIAGLVVCGLAHSARADGWTQPKGEFQLISTASYYNTDHRFNADGDRVPQTTYDKWELNPYLEYGLTDSLTLGGSLYLDRADDSRDSSAGMGDTLLFVRQRLWQNGNAVLSLQPAVTIPGPSRDQRPAIGNSEPTASLSLQGGYGFGLFGQHHYLQADLGYTHRFGTPDDQVIASFTAGFHLTESVVLMPQVFQTLSLPAPDTGDRFTLSPRDNYDLTKVQLSALYYFDPNDAVQVGAFEDVAGRNAGQGGGLLLAYWKHF